MTNKEIVKLLNQAFSNFQQITQWLPNNLDTANHYDSKAAAIIEILEEDLFGHTRARFKRGYQPKYKFSGNTIYDRFYFIVKEGKYQKDIKKVCYFGVEELHSYFEQLSELRESFNK
jgi:hypothetical protein